jgi:hypothetical protein
LNLRLIRLDRSISSKNSGSLPHGKVRGLFGILGCMKIPRKEFSAQKIAKK